MNIKQLFLPLFGALALIGCNKEAVEPTSSNDTETQPVRLALTMEATADASEMRAVSFDANQNVPPTTHDQYSNWQTHCFLRKVGDDTNQAYALIDWDATVVGGKMHLKMKGHTLTLLQSGSKATPVPQPGERWSIVGITGGGKLNEERTRVDFAPDAELDKNLQPHQARVPFTFEKTFFTVSAASGERSPQISVKFEPQGALINVYVNNKTNRGGQVVDTDLKLLTNALSNNGYFDYSLTNGQPSWTFANGTVVEESIGRPVFVAKDAGKHYVLWGMPRSGASTPAEGFKSEVYLRGYNILSEGSTTDKPKVRNEAFTNGVAYPMSFDVDGVLSPLSTIETTPDSNHVIKVMHRTTGELIDPRSLNTIASGNVFYSYEEVLSLFGQDKNLEYYLPTLWELGMLFPAPVQGAEPYRTSYNFSGTDIGPVTELVQFEAGEGTEKQKEVTSYYKSVGNVLYALRFAGYDNNSKRTAFRYEYVELGKLKDNTTTLHGLKIMTRHLGNDLANYPEGQVPTDNDFWHDARTSTMTIPALGHKAQPKSQGILGYVWSSSPANIPNYSYHAGFSQARVFLSRTSRALSTPFILFKK